MAMEDLGVFYDHLDVLPANHFPRFLIYAALSSCSHLRAFSSLM